MICCFVLLLTKSSLLISKLQQGTLFFKICVDVINSRFNYNLIFYSLK